MPAYNRILAAIAAVLLAIATALGAWASHGLAVALSATDLRSLETGIDYQFFHALGLLVLAFGSGRDRASLTLRIATTAIAAGTVLFCGGVYASSLGGPAWLAGVAPAGGSLLILGWLTTSIALLAAGRSDAI